MEFFETAFKNDVNVFQDGTIPFYRDVDGSLWAISGHSHMGDICMFKGSNIHDMKKLYPISTQFCVGHADYAFNGIRYPEGVKARGSVWPFGFYICPKTHRFFAFFHNETGWNGKGTGYDKYGYCETPYFDSDFRHIGLMHSDDEGKTWYFDRWVITGEMQCISNKFNPENNVCLGQENKILNTGSGDFSMFVEDGYLYLFYNIINTNPEEQWWENCNVYVARTKLRSDGIMGDFVKYYNGSFCEPGNLGKESSILDNAWHPSIVFNTKNKCYYMAYNLVQDHTKTYVLSDKMYIRKSKNLFDWKSSELCDVKDDITGHYFTLLPKDFKDQKFVTDNTDFEVLISGNAADVKGLKIKI